MTVRKLTVRFGIGLSLASAAFFSACASDPSCDDLGKSCGGSSGSSIGGGAQGGRAGNGGSSGTGGSGAKGGGSSSGSGNAGGSGVGGDMAGGSGESGAAGAPVVPCDTTKTPRTEACLVHDDYAVFVAPTGKDSATGTMSAPLASLTKAIEVAAGSKFIVVCDATYDEHVLVSAGAQVFGGFSCTGGSWAPESKAPLFKPSDAGPALKVDTVSDAVVLDTVNFEVPDAKLAGGTALTALVNASPHVTLKKVSLTAGSGMNGADGTLTPFTYPTALDGNPETVGATGGAEKDCTCQGTLMSVGGLGGSPASGGQSGVKGLPDRGGGAGGDPSFGDCSAGSGGKKGGDASAASPSAGASTLGLISSAGWQPSPGADGTNGSPGQGGGGGASLNSAGHGGGGGCGGCGGNGAKGGQGGGASIALLALNSPITLDSCTLTTKDAGSGGAGHVGQTGQQTVGGGGSVLSTVNSCGGGTGGKGGDGGASGGGAGGISVGIVWKGTTAPTLLTTTTATGKAGAKGVGGLPGSNDGIAGLKQDVLNLP